MQVPTACPDPGRLSDLLDGRLAPADDAALASHAETCVACQRLLDGLSGDAAEFSGLAQHAEAPAEPALRRALDDLLTLDFRQGAETREPEETLALDFLSPPDDPRHLGRLGHYEVLEILGRGGMGVVLKAYDPGLERTVAIKVLSPALASQPWARRRLVREARAAAAVAHENVVSVHSVEDAGQAPFLVMEHIVGVSLEERLAQPGPLGLPEVIGIARQTAAGLSAAHAQGLVHCDVKPGNILLTAPAQGRSPSVKITDFGLARALDQLGGSGQRSAAGTPQYMSPEQIAAGNIDHRSDLYALGVLLFRMVTGQEPFTGPTVSAVWSQHLFEPPPRPSAVAPGSVPPWLDELILRLLAKEPTGRPQSAAEVADALERGPGVASMPAAEQARLEALRRYRILDTDPEQPFDDLATLASHVCGTPIALITLLDADRQWFKSRVGISLRETARDVSFCTHTIRQAEPLIVPDALQDERFAGSPLVCSLPQARFYAGIPLVTPEGHALGALCVMDRVPRQLTADQLSALAALSRLVLKQMEIRRDLLELKALVGEAGGA